MMCVEVLMTARWYRKELIVQKGCQPHKQEPWCSQCCIFEDYCNANTPADTNAIFFAPPAAIIASSWMGSGVVRGIGGCKNNMFFGPPSLSLQKFEDHQQEFSSSWIQIVKSVLSHDSEIFLQGICQQVGICQSGNLLEKQVEIGLKDNFLVVPQEQ